MSRRGGSRRSSTIDRAVGVVLTATAVLGALCIVATAGSLVLDLKPLVFTSGSMAPDIETGALGLARTVDARDVVEGDVVSVVGRDGARVTHRVVSVQTPTRETSLVLKGDANAVPDAESYRVTSVDRVVADVPRLGYVAAWFSGRGGIVLAGAVVVLSLLVLMPRAPVRVRGGARRAPARRRDGGNGVEVRS